jgi:outer membrane protein TolC
MVSMLFFLFLLLLEAGLTGSSLGQPAQPGGLTLARAVETALANNPLIQATGAGRELAEAKLQEALSGHFPLLQAQETFTNSNNPVFVFGSTLEQARFAPQDFQLHSLNNPDSLNNFRTAITLRQPVLNQRQTTTAISQARIGREQSERAREAVEQQLRFEVIRAYYGILIAAARKDVSEEAVRTGEAHVKQISDRFEKGLVVQSDLLAAQVQLAVFRQQKIQAEGDLAIAHAALNTVLGLPVDGSHKVSGLLTKKDFDLPDQEQWIRQALLHRPDYLRTSLALQSTKERVHGAKGQFLPRLDLFATYGASGKNLTSSSPDYTISTSLTFNLFDPGRKARVKQAVAAEAMARAEQEQLANQIRLEIVRSYRQYLSALERLHVADQAVGQASETLRIIQDRYRAGLTTITEVLRSETALVQARLNLILARYDHYVGYGELLLHSGKLVDVQAFAS